MVIGSDINEKYIESTYKDAIVTVVDTAEDAVRAVAEKRTDVAFINTYAAQTMLFPDYPNLKMTIYP